MLANNTKYILRNYLARHAIKEAYTRESYQQLSKLDQLLRAPFAEHPDDNA